MLILSNQDINHAFNDHAHIQLFLIYEYLEGSGVFEIEPMIYLLLLSLVIPTRYRSLQYFIFGAITFHYFTL